MRTMEDYQSTILIDGWRREKLTSFPFFTLSDVEKIYQVINNNSSSGFEQFAKRAKEIATQIASNKTDYTYQFMNELALFELFQEFLPDQLRQKGIDCWGRLMQYIS